MCVNCRTRLTFADHTNQSDNFHLLYFCCWKTLTENADKAESVAPDKPVQTAQPNLGQPYIHALNPLFPERGSSIY